MAESFAVVDERWKLIHNTRRLDGVPEFELFDRDADASDRLNRADVEPEVTRTLLGELETWRAKLAETRLAPDVDPESTLTRGEQMFVLQAMNDGIEI